MNLFTSAARTFLSSYAATRQKARGDLSHRRTDSHAFRQQWCRSHRDRAKAGDVSHSTTEIHFLLRIVPRPHAWRAVADVVEKSPAAWIYAAGTRCCARTLPK